MLHFAVSGVKRQEHSSRPFRPPGIPPAEPGARAGGCGHRRPDALAPQIDAVQGEALVQAVRQFDLELSQLHRDLTSVVLHGEYPPAEQAQEYL